MLMPLPDLKGRLFDAQAVVESFPRGSRGLRQVCAASMPVMIRLQARRLPTKENSRTVHESPCFAIKELQRLSLPVFYTKRRGPRLGRLTVTQAEPRPRAGKTAPRGGSFGDAARMAEPSEERG